MHHHVINAIVEHDCHPVAGSLRGRPRFFMRGTSSSPSPEVSSRCSTSLLPRASSISFFSSVAFETRIQNSRKIQVRSGLDHKNGDCGRLFFLFFLMFFNVFNVERVFFLQRGRVKIKVTLKEVLADLKPGNEG